MEKQQTNTQPSHNRGTGSFHGVETNARILKITGWMTGIYFLIELGLGFYSGSVAVISDAFHTFSAVGGILIAFVANRISSREANANATYGFRRAEIVGALLNGVFLLLMALYVLYMGYMRLGADVELPTGIMLVAALGGLITEFIAFKLIYQEQKTNMNMKGAFWHIMQTFVGSILILIAAAVIALTGYTPIDAILGMAFGLVLLWASYKIIADAFNVFMQTVPKEVDIEQVKTDLLALPGVTAVRHMHAWVLTSDKNIFSAHLEIEKSENGQQILEMAERLLREKYQFYFSTLQLETSHTTSVADEINIIN
ncbi:zinc ABC transporter [bacterium]|nr:zinc ABC transporter [bacterium]|tara:strand:+ start:139 stop:1077 length:939 start_codon:yes stop_codon:yes gene_type:complete